MKHGIIKTMKELIQREAVKNLTTEYRKALTSLRRRRNSRAGHTAQGSC